MVFQSDPYSVLLVSASEKLNAAVLPLLPGSDFWPVTAVGSLSRAKRLLLQQRYDLVIVNAPLPDGMGTDFAVNLCSETDAAVALLIRSELYEETNAATLPSGVVVVSKPTNSQLLLQVIRGLCAMRERLRAMRERQTTVEEKMEEITYCLFCSLFFYHSVRLLRRMAAISCRSCSIHSIGDMWKGTSLYMVQNLH